MIDLDFREDSKKDKMSVYDKLSKEDKEVKKLLNDIIGIRPVIDDYSTELSNTSKIDNYIDSETKEQISNQNELNDYNNIMTIPDNDENVEYNY